MLYWKGMEEFENDQRTDDDERRRAEARALRLEPLHSDIQPEESPALASTMATERATLTQQNVTNDTEDTADGDQLRKPAGSPLEEKTILHKSPSRRKFTVSVVSAIVIVILVVVIFWLIQQ